MYIDKYNWLKLKNTNNVLVFNSDRQMLLSVLNFMFLPVSPETNKTVNSKTNKSAS